MQPQSSNPRSRSEIVFTINDLHEAASDGVISPEVTANLITWAYEREPTAPVGSHVQADHVEYARDPQVQASTVEHPKGLNLVTVAYYFGAMLMISAFAWLLGNVWSTIGSGGL